MLREARKLGIRSCVSAIFVTGQFVRKHRLLSASSLLSYRFPVMGVTVSSKKENRVVKRVPQPSFASFSTTGTLTTTDATEEGEVVWITQNIGWLTVGDCL